MKVPFLRHCQTKPWFIWNIFERPLQLIRRLRETSTMKKISTENASCLWQGDEVKGVTVNKEGDGIPYIFLKSYWHLSLTSVVSTFSLQLRKSLVALHASEGILGFPCWRIRSLLLKEDSWFIYMEQILTRKVYHHSLLSHPHLLHSPLSHLIFVSALSSFDVSHVFLWMMSLWTSHCLP